MKINNTKTTKNLLSATLGVALLSLAQTASAASVTVPNTFVNGQRTDASEMNANFDAVKNAVDDNDARIATLDGRADQLQANINALSGAASYQLADYSAPDSVTNWEFQRQQYVIGQPTMVGADACTKIKWRLGRVDISGGTRETIEWLSFTPSDEYCGGETSVMERNSSGMYHLSDRGANNNGVYTVTHDKPFLWMPATMQLGMSWGDTSMYTREYSNYQGQGARAERGARMIARTLQGVEDVTVPAGSFQDCLRIHEVRTDDYTHRRTRWMCPNIGTVKQIKVFESNGPGIKTEIRELVSYN